MAPLRFLTALLASLSLHTSLLFISTHPKEAPHPTVSEVAKVRIVPVQPRREGRNPSPPTLPRRAQRPGHGGPRKPSTENLRYTDLFPSTQSYIPPSHGIRSSKPYQGKHLGELVAVTTEIHGELEIPLALRRTMHEGRAWAKLRLIDEEIEIEYLGGQRDLRAALFECLNAEGNYALMQSAFRYFDSNWFKISLTYETRFVEGNSFEFQTRQKILDHELEITIKRFTKAPKYGVTGIAIEDKYSRMAKDRDRRHWRRLTRSPAYRKVIRRYRIPSPVSLRSGA